VGVVALVLVGKFWWKLWGTESVALVYRQYPLKVPFQHLPGGGGAGGSEGAISRGPQLG
jgi:hypothetical protein